jgi:general secretion pathway protein G
MIRLTTTSRANARPRRPATADRPATRPGRAPTTDDGQRTTDKKRGFTLIELLVVIIVLAILIALLLPAINGALRTARNAAVSAEINQLATALASFNTKYGGYPPSRVILMENGNYTGLIGNTTPVSTLNPVPPAPPGWAPAGGTGDITVGQLATRTLLAFRKFWPKLQLSTNGSPPPNIANANGTYWYDFNGNGVLDPNPYVLQGHESLVFFLGGIPLPNPLQIPITAPGSIQLSMTGFGKDPANPFSNSIVGNAMYNTNRQPPLYEFSPSRLFLDPSNLSNAGASPGIPGYYDTLNGGPPIGIGTGTGTINFYAYFSAYGSGNYDPNDVNFYEADLTTVQGPIELQYWVNFPTTGGTVNTGVGTTYLAVSPSPNPFTSTATAAVAAGTVTYQAPQTFQIISSGGDGLYGLGGQYTPTVTAGAASLPLDTQHTVNTNDTSIRQREYDNLTNFKSGTLQ